MDARRLRAAATLCAAAGLLLFSNQASAQANATPNQVLVVPYNAENPRLPHPAHEQAPITLKAMVRNATCGGNYRVRWDTNRNGNFDDEQEYTFTRNGTTLNLWDIGRTFTVPNVDRDRALNVTVRVQVPCAAEGNPANHYKFGTFRLFVYDFTPGAPDTWTDEQLEIMTIMAVQESMWYGHRMMNEFGGNHTTSTLYGQISNRSREQWGGGMINAWIMALNGHLGAFPTGTINWYNVPRDRDYEEANERRWDTDPYAETITRYLNGTIRADSRAVGIVAGKEDNTCGYDANRQQIRCNRADGNGGDRLGAWIGNADNGPHTAGVEDPATYLMGVYLAASAIMTPSYAGVPVQVGHASVIGRPFEWLIQGQVDLLAEQQMYQGEGNGGWYYHRYTGSSGNYSDLSVTQWALIGLEAAEKAGGFAGVVVPNNVKYRSLINTYNNTYTDGGGRYRTYASRSCTSLMLTGGDILGHRWAGVHNMARNNTVPFPNDYPGRTQAQLVDDYQRALSYTKRYWYSNNKLHCGGRQDRFWDAGDYKCGNNNATYNGGKCGSTYTIYSHQKGYRTGEPELDFDDRDWLRQFATYYIRAQDRVVNNGSGRDANYGVFGRIIDTFCSRYSITCNYMAPGMMSGMGGLILTPTIFNPKPVAIASVQPDQVVEGCVGGNAGQVVFNHGESFHPGSDQSIVAYQWDVDASNGLWWDTNANPDYESDNAQPFEYRYNSSGAYTATLRVVDNLGQTQTTVVRITVDAAANVPPSAAHGGPYVIEVGQNLQLQGRATDQNIPCGDRLTVSWDLDNDGAFDDANGASANVGWAAVQGLAPGVAHRIAIRVRDNAGEISTAETTLTIYPREPVASGRANPNPAACQQQVSFDGSASSHPNPQRAVAQYDWDIDGDGNFDGSGAIFRGSYPQFGTYDVTLRVTDDLGRTDTDEFQVQVNQGNTPPVARVAVNEINVLEEEPLVLDGRPSNDVDVPCGDSIVSYRWDLDGDGQFDDANGANPTVAWAQVQNLLDWPADRETGLPANTVRLQVTDEFGATSTADVIVRVYRANPVAVVVQVPQPSPIRIDTGFSSTTLDGRQSFSTVPGVDIVRYDWDLDDNGAFEVEDRPTTEFRKVFDPVPLPPREIPETFIRLRVTDANGRTDVIRYEVEYDIPPTPPTADADPTDPPERGYHILVGEGLTLNGSQSFDPDADEGDWIEFFRWDLTYDEDDGFDADVTAQAANQAEQEEAAATDLAWADLQAAGIAGPGSFTVRLQVEDTTRLTATDDSVLNVYARDPVAALDANPNPAACGGRVTFDGSASEHPHPDINVVGYAWDFDGDGNPDAAGQSVQRAFDEFTFGQPNRVTLTVTDSRGNSGSTTVDVNVTEGNRAPVAQAGGFRDGDGRVVGPYAIAAGEGLQLSAAGSSDPDAACGDAIQRYRWDLGNNGSFEGEGAQLNLTWAQLNAAGINGPGQYDVRVQVTDRFGVTSDGLATLVVANGPDADAQANPNRAGCEQRVEFTAAGSRFFGPADQGFSIVAYDWDLDGDGQFDDAQGETFERAVVAEPDANGQIRVSATVRVTDAAGRTDTATTVVVIDVQNQPPVANAGGPYQTGPVRNGFADVVLDGRGSLDPNAPCDAIAIYKWDTDGDGRYGTDDNPDDLEGATVRYNNNRWRVNTVETVGLIVCDDFGACSQPAEGVIEIQDQAPPSGEIISPRAGDDAPCLGAGNFEVELDVADPAGDVVNVTVTIAGQAVGQANVDTPDDGSARRVTVAINPALVPEGRHAILVNLEDSEGAEVDINAGGRLTFDRTAPRVTIGNQLNEGTCYNGNAVPNPDVVVDDNLDNAPNTNTETVEDGCGRTMRVTATDACGNVGQAERSYLIAQPVAVDIAGVDEGALVSDARITWDVIGPDECASAIDASFTRDGGAAVPYPENQLLNQAGVYAMTVRVANCAGVARQQIRNFAINSPPVAVPITAGNPSADPALPNAYVALEGAGLQLDGSESRAPEPGDNIARYQWDLNGDGAFDAEGALVDFDTSDNGVFNGTLRVTDSLGAFSDQVFRVTVLDVDPTADAGGPYIVDQGSVFRPDGRASQPGSAADLIREYEWDFGDGSDPVRGNALTQPEHTYAANGTYNLRLTVRDEDSEDTIIVRVTVRDVDPIIDEIVPPEDPRELVPVTFSIVARAGADSDPLTRYEWDFDGDGVPEYAGPDLTEVTHQFDAAGRHVVSVTVRDQDSSSVQGIALDVRELTLAEIVEWIRDEVEADLADANLNPFARFQLTGIEDVLDRAAWGEANGERGVTLMALRAAVTRLIAAQGAGADYGFPLWGLSRQMKREMDRMRQRILDDEDLPRDEDHPSMQLSADHLGALTDLYEDPDFRADLRTNDRVAVVNDVMFEAIEAFYWQADTTYQCNEFGDFELPDLGDPRAVRPVANQINSEDLRPALTSLRGEFLAYAAKADAPAADEITSAAQKMERILELQGLLLGPNCEENEVCITDREALDLELEGAQLVRDLEVAANSGAWVRQWQSCMVLALKFRIELSIQRVEFACGANSAVSQRARQVQAIGLDFVEQNRDAEALSYYSHPDRQCTLVQVYDQCLVDADVENEPYDGPLECLNELVCRDVAARYIGGACEPGDEAECMWPAPDGNSMEFTIELRNASRGPCEAADLALEPSQVPANWVVDVAPAEGVEPGQTGDATVTVRWPDGTPAADYRLNFVTRQSGDPTLGREFSMVVRVP